MRQTSIWSAAIFLALLAFPALASDFAGVVKTSRGVATIDRTGTKVPVVAGTRINQGDRIVTANNGYLGITMSDDTLLTLGPGSLLVIDAYGFDPKTHDGNFLASLREGRFPWSRVS